MKDHSEETDGVKETPILNLIQNIQSGIINPVSLKKEERQQCIEVLYLEGYTVPELAQILQRNERTVKRDLEEIRKRNAISPNAELAKQLVGEMVMMARLHRGRIERLAKAKEAKPIEKGQLEYLAWKVSKEMIEKLQDLGILPSKPTEVVGDIYHHYASEDPIRSLDEVKAIMDEIRLVDEKSGQFDPESIKEIEDLNAQFEKTKLAHMTAELLKKREQTNQENKNEK